MSDTKPDDYAAITKFLRGKGCDQPEGSKAAAAIERQAAEIARLTAERDGIEQEALDWRSAWKDVTATAEAAESQVRQLQEALAACERDAARYRWLRVKGACPGAADYDDIVDAAMSKEPQK